MKISKLSLRYPVNWKLTDKSGLMQNSMNTLKMPNPNFLCRKILTVVLAVAACAASAEPQQAVSPLPFSTDGCSLFPDRALIGNADWCSCCVKHDLAYWRGGTEEERLEADEALKSCVTAASGNAQLGALMFDGVRAGGGPYFFTPYRWGYGWPYGRMYRALSAQEDAQISELRARYLESNPGLACPVGSHRDEQGK